MTSRYDVAVIGAGPAGMAAASEAAGRGLSVAVLDEQPGPGGQIYRSIEQTSPEQRDRLGKDYAAGLKLVEAFRSSNATYIPQAVVWNVDPDLSIDYSANGGSVRISASALVVATGAIERPTPMPGWTLPGVMTGGALQILLKAGGVVNDKVVLVGCGPLLYLIAMQLTDAGTPPQAIVETMKPGRLWRAARHLPRALLAPSYLLKGLAMIRRLKRAGVPIYPSAHSVRIEGGEAAEALCFASGGRSHRIAADAIALHQGVVPNQQMTRLLGCEHVWNKGQRSFVPVTDDSFETSLPNIYIAGDGAGIAGAAAAALRGRVAALRIAEKAGKASVADRDPLLKSLRADRAIRPFLEALYAPSDEILAPDDGTLICRCEEITAGQIRKAVDLGAPGPNQIKSFLRCGMGPCQGRICGPAVTEIIAARRREEPSAAGYYRIRPPLKPLALAELATLEPEATTTEPL